MLRRISVVALLLLAAAAPAANVTLSSDGSREYLLDEVPNYATILRDQWSNRVPSDSFESERGSYGRLGENVAPRQITLEESIALALENNTGLRIRKLSPIAATARVRAAYAKFDPEFFGEANKNRQNSPVQTISPFTNADPLNDINDQSIFSDVVNWNAGVRKTIFSNGRLGAEWLNAKQASNPTVVNLVNPDYVTALNLTLNQPLLRDFGWRFAYLVVDVAQINEDRTYFDYAANVAGLIENVERAYWGYVLAIENVQVQEKGLDLAKELLRQNEGRFKVGSLPRTSVLESEAEVARRESDLVLARARQRIARDLLRALVNATQDDTDTLIMIEPADAPKVKETEFDLEESLKVGYRQRPELLAARSALDGRKLERKIAENRLLPRLDLTARIGLNGLGGTDAGLVGPTPTVGPGLPTPTPGAFNFAPNPQVLGGYGRSLELLTDGRYYQYLVGAQVTIPLDNATAKAEYAQAKIDTESARLSLRQTEEDVTTQITQAVNDLKALLKAVEATRVARELAEENVKNQQARYEVGLATTKDLIDFTERLTRAEQAQIEALTSYNIRLAQWRQAEGTLLESHNVHLERSNAETKPWWAWF
jgi:outer membrane protein